MFVFLDAPVPYGHPELAVVETATTITTTKATTKEDKEKEEEEEDAAGDCYEDTEIRQEKKE